MAKPIWLQARPPDIPREWLGDTYVVEAKSEHDARFTEVYEGTLENAIGVMARKVQAGETVIVRPSMDGRNAGHARRAPRRRG